MEQNEELTKHQVAAGRIGGLSRSDAKRAAVKLNLAKARAARWKPKVAGPQANVLGAPIVQPVQQKEQTEVTEMLRDSQTAIAIGGPIRSGFGGDQPDSRNGQSENGVARDSRYSEPCEQDVRPLPNQSGADKG